MKKKIRSLFFSRVQHYWYRQNAIKYFFILFLLAFSYRIIDMQNLHAVNKTVQEKASLQSNSSTTRQARRGDILDRNGHVLASNLILQRVNLDPTLLQSAYIPKLAEALMMPEETLREAINKKLNRKRGRRELIVKKNIRLTSPILDNLKALKKERLEVCTTKQKKISPGLFNKILGVLKLKENPPVYVSYDSCKRRKISGLALQADSRRYYPKSASLAPLIGRLNHNKKGIAGIESEFESVLAGQNGKTHLVFNQQSKGSYFNPITTHELKHGQDITLTIDANAQFHAYTAIKKSVKFHEADYGSIIILAPNGEILALANYPADDPNDKRSYNPSHYLNHALSDRIEPGSTMKPFTMLLALEKGRITANDDELIDVSKRIGHIKSTAEVRKYGKAITVRKILQTSHNLGTVSVSEKLSKKEVYDTWDKLGFGHAPGLMPSVETSGLLRHFESWALSDKRVISYGYGAMQTSLAQLARAYLVFANDGALPSLKLIKGANTDEQLTPVFSKKATLKIADLLDSVANWGGSGHRARIKGYTVAGKTGTAEKIINGRYSKKGINRTFFTGFTPVVNPKYIVAVMLDYPKKCYNWFYTEKRTKCGGGSSAALVFKDAMTHILTNDQSIKLLAKN